MKRQDAARLFALNNLSIESELRSVQQRVGFDIGKSSPNRQKNDETLYPQFGEEIRQQALRMAGNYRLFYCLENSIRELIVARLSDPDAYGDEWWNKCVPEVVKTNAEKNQKKEIASGVTLRSSDAIDYTTFGELGEIIKSNWDIFGEMFRDIKAIERILSDLNTLRGPIAHCKPLAEDEELRLHLRA